MEKKLLKNYVTFMAEAMKANGCPKEIKDEEDVLSNLYYLSKEDNRGSRYLPLQYKRIVEKLICGMFNSAFEYSDKEDVYYEKIGNTVLCCANVRWVQYAEDGSKKVLGHGFHALTLSEVFPGTFMSDEDRISKWKSTVIGGAKSRALYDGGIGLEFYGDVFAPEENLDENDHSSEKKEEKKTRKRKAKDEDKTYSESGMPIPKAKRAEAEPEEKAKEEPETKDEPKDEPETAVFTPVETPVTEAVPENPKKEYSLEQAKEVIADIGNYKGVSLGEIYEKVPRNILFLARKSNDDDVRAAALTIIESDENLKEIFV